jgi:hypothetical protein
MANEDIKFSQPYPVAAVDALFDVCTIVISAVMLLDERLAQTKLSVFRDLLASCVLLSYSPLACQHIRISKYALHKEHQKISMRSNVRQRTYVLLLHNNRTITAFAQRA